MRPANCCLICNRACRKPALLPSQRALILVALTGRIYPPEHRVTAILLTLFTLTLICCSLMNVFFGRCFTAAFFMPEI